MPHRTGDSATEIRDLGRALSVLRSRTGLSQSAAAERIAITAQAWQRYEAGERQALLRTDLQDRLTGALGFSRDDLTAELARLRGLPEAHAGGATVHRFPRAFAAAGLEASTLPIRDREQAGAWLAGEDLHQGAPRTYPAARDPRFPAADQWLSEITGDSMDQLRIFDGDLAHLVDAVGIGYAPRTGDIVEVERVRFGGQLRELTLKQVEVAPDDTVTLWPRSSNPRWREPLELHHGVPEGEEIEVRIRALLLNTIRRF